MTLERTVKQYIQLWNERDSIARRAGIEQLFADDCTYTDPAATATGRDGIDRLISAVQAEFGGLTFSLEGKVDEHHEVARFTWHARAETGEPLVIGFDVVVTELGKIKQVVGFLDRAPKGVA
jgi:hypothetical protein